LAFIDVSQGKKEKLRQFAFWRKPVHSEESVYRFMPKTKMGLFASTIVLLWVLKWLFVSARLMHKFPGLGFLFGFLDLLLGIAAIYYIWNFYKKMRGRLLWKIRRRLILAHIFIGAIPVLAVVGIFCVSGLLFYYQLTYYLISNQIGIQSSQIHVFNLALRDGLQELMTGVSPPNPAVLKQAIDSHAKYLLAPYPSASIIFRYANPFSHEVEIYANQTRDPEQIKKYQIPGWLGDREFSGLVAEDLQPQLYSRRLLLRSIVTSEFRTDLPFSIEISVPFDRHLMSILKAGFGQDMMLAGPVSPSNLNVFLQNSDLTGDKIIDSTFESKNPSIDASVRSIFLFPISWADGQETSSGDALLVELSTSKLIGNLFRSENEVGKRILRWLEGTIAFFLVVEILSVVIGLLLTKSITNAVHSLDLGTELVKQGDFSHRIVVQSEDQLGALAASFNQMTEYVQRLVKERVQKERLERELEIAKEVQERLFPEQNPRVGRLDVSGICLPARVVSGDYYDFLFLGENELGLALADICGKGISAALLMSSLQATLRSNVLNFWHQNGLSGERALAQIVEKLNFQIHSYTSANKFASFFYAVYDDAQQTLTYCNAGHNPPLHFSGESFQRLCTGGTVVGIFADSQYEQETIHLQAGDFLVAYTDGIVESVNEQGEEFGEKRLIELIQKYRGLDADKLKGVIVEQVLAWTAVEERADDMTLVVAKMSG
jgi:phosphoserine phosphatase RsbU/P